MNEAELLMLATFISHMLHGAPLQPCSLFTLQRAHFPSTKNIKGSVYEKEKENTGVAFCSAFL